jgi:DNA-binding transcriptional ArsR family regulator
VREQDHRDRARAKLEAIDHPLRLAILTSLSLRPASIKELASALDAPPGKVRYQLGRLRKAELAELKEERQRRGVAEQVFFVRPEPFSREEVSQLSAVERETVVGGMLKALLGDALKGARGGAFTRRDDFILARTPLSLDEEGWADAVKIFRETLSQLLVVREETRLRLEREGGSTSDAFSFLLLFDTAPAEQSDQPDQ